jgi:hypothetical protein
MLLTTKRWDSRSSVQFLGSDKCFILAIYDPTSYLEVGPQCTSPSPRTGCISTSSSPTLAAGSRRIPDIGLSATWALPPRRRADSRRAARCTKPCQAPEPGSPRTRGRSALRPAVYPHHLSPAPPGGMRIVLVGSPPGGPMPARWMRGTATDGNPNSSSQQS